MKSSTFNFKDLLIILLIFIVSNSNILYNKYIILALDILLIPLIRTWNNKRINVLLIAILCWLIVNVIVLLHFKPSLQLFRFFNFIFQCLLFPFLLLLYCGNSFWNKFERDVYFLTLLSLPIFLLNIIFPQFFNSLSYVFKPITSTLFQDPNYWSSFFYVHCPYHDVTSYSRNAGFMWEPGAFAWIIILGIILHWLVHGVKFDKKFFLYSVSLLTTLSTAGYLALFIVVTAGIVAQKKISYLLLLVPIVFTTIYLYSNLDFMGGKIDSYVGSLDVDFTDFVTEGFNATKLDRLMYAKYSFKEILKYPFGFGLYKPTDISSIWDFVGVGGLIDLMFMWGIPLFLVILSCFWLFFKSLFISQNVFVVALLTLAYFIMIFSNPCAFNPLTYLIVFSPIIFEHSTSIHNNFAVKR